MAYHFVNVTGGWMVIAVAILQLSVLSVWTRRDYLGLRFAVDESLLDLGRSFPWALRARPRRLTRS